MLRVSRYDFVVVLNLLIEVIFLMNDGKSFHNEAPLNFTHLCPKVVFTLSISAPVNNSTSTLHILWRFDIAAAVISVIFCDKIVVVAIC